MLTKIKRIRRKKYATGDEARKFENIPTASQPQQNVSTMTGATGTAQQATAQTGTLSSASQVGTVTGSLSGTATGATAAPTTSAIAQAAQGQLSSGALAQVVSGTAATVNGQTATLPADIQAAVASNPAQVTATIMQQPAAVQAQVASLPTDALVSTQINTLLDGIDTGSIPTWARGAVENVEKNLAARGLSKSSIGRDALVNAIIQNALPIAQSNATAYNKEHHKI